MPTIVLTQEWWDAFCYLAIDKHNYFPTAWPQSWIDIRKAFIRHHEMSDLTTDQLRQAFKGI